MDFSISAMDSTRRGALVSRRINAGWSAFSVDIETNPADGDRIFKIGAARSDSDSVVSLSTGRLDPDDVVRRVDTVAQGARLLVGHNLRRHDLPQLRRQYPGLRFLNLPILDTLEFSAIAFPANPYHRLDKGYKLLSDSRNDPLKDARLALDLLGDEVDALADMHRIDPRWVSLLHYLLLDEAPLEALLASVRLASSPDLTTAVRIARDRFGEICCSTRLGRFAETDIVASPEHRMALAFALGWIRVSGGNSVLPIWVHSAIPEVRSLIGELREHACGQAGCRYCHEQHDPETLLFTHFQKTAFRPRPAASDGTSLQRAIVVAGLERKSLRLLDTAAGTEVLKQGARAHQPAPLLRDQLASSQAYVQAVGPCRSLQDAASLTQKYLEGCCRPSRDQKHSRPDQHQTKTPAEAGALPNGQSACQR